MRWKRALAAATTGAATLIWMIIPAASASTSPATWSAASTITAYHNCNLTSSNAVHGCALTHGSLEAVTLVSPTTPNLTNFSYDFSSDQFKQAGTNLCLEYNASSSSDPVRMDTCNNTHLSQVWILGDYTKYQIENSYATSQLGTDSCLEGSEEAGFGIRLTIAPCADQYNGENWAPVS